ncbi:unnamed protein product [Gadus morhua 'NCC']
MAGPLRSGLLIRSAAFAQPGSGWTPTRWLNYGLVEQATFHFIAAADSSHINPFSSSSYSLSARTGDNNTASLTSAD